MFYKQKIKRSRLRFNIIISAVFYGDKILKRVILSFVLSWKKRFCALVAFFISDIAENFFKIVLYQEVNLGTASFTCNSIVRFPIVKVLNFILDICGVKYFYIVEHV